MDRIEEIREFLRKRKAEMEEDKKRNPSKYEPKYPYELFGIECGEGWKPLYQPIIDYINKYNEKVKDGEARIEIHQIKEKFGGLRFYTNFYTKELSDMIDEAEDKSYNVCEECGRPCKTINSGGWIYTLCEECYKGIEERREKTLNEFQNKIREKNEKKGT